jgi:hypothetical protein
MPYVKISDPNIIDLAAWHQVINVINQHSDTLSAITNNFGLQGTGVTDWNGETEIYEEFNPGSQKILYGKFIIDTRDNSTQDLNTNGGRMFYQTIDFDNETTATASFSAKPVITVTPALVGSTVTSDRNVGLVCTVIATTDKGFTVRVIKARELTQELPSTVADPKPVHYFQINWIAIGPK